MGETVKTDSPIAVVFAANDAYIPMFGVALHSLVKHTNPQRDYHIYLLNEGIGNGHWMKIKEMEQLNIHIERVDVSERMRKYNIPTVNHLSKETTYRLLIADLFPDYKKVLYLDSDILIKADVASLYDENLDGMVFAASRARLFSYSVRYIRDELHIDTKNYFNAGVLLINAPMFREYQIGQKALHMLSEKKYNTQDQDVLNILGQEKNNPFEVKILDGRWNYEWEHLADENLKPYIDEVREGSLELKDEAYIIHYTTAKKPWNHPEIELADLWWREARETLFYEELVEEGSSQRFIEKWNYPANAFRSYLFPWKMIQPDEKIVLYAAGVVGRAFLEQIRITSYCQIIAVCDKNPDSIRDLSLPVLTLDEMARFPAYRIIIAVEGEDTARTIEKDLIELGIEKSRLLWQDYRRTL